MTQEHVPISVAFFQAPLPTKSQTQHQLPRETQAAGETAPLNVLLGTHLACLSTWSMW